MFGVINAPQIRGCELFWFGLLVPFATFNKTELLRYDSVLKMGSKFGMRRRKSKTRVIMKKMHPKVS